MVNRAMRKSTVSVQAAAIAQALPIHSSESTSAWPQSSEGENGFKSSIGTPLLRLATWLRESYRRFSSAGQGQYSMRQEADGPDPFASAHLFAVLVDEWAISCVRGSSFPVS